MRWIRNFFLRLDKKIMMKREKSLEGRKKSDRDDEVKTFVGWRGK